MITIPNGTTKAQLFDEWTGLIDIPLYRQRTEREEARMVELEAVLYPDNETLTKRLDYLESTIDEASHEAAREMLEEIIEIRNRLQLDGWADDSAEWAMRQKRGEPL